MYSYHEVRYTRCPLMLKKRRSSATITWPCQASVTKIDKCHPVRMYFGIQVENQMSSEIRLSPSLCSALLPRACEGPSLQIGFGTCGDSYFRAGEGRDDSLDNWNESKRFPIQSSKQLLRTSYLSMSAMRMRVPPSS